jgi:Beta-lactamase enzyme family
MAGPKRIDVSFVSDAALTTALNPLALLNDFRDMCVAVVDLTGLTSPDLTATPAFWGWNLSEATTVGSTSKLAVMLAAFELRRVVQAAHAGRPADPLSDVTEAVVKDWAAASDSESRDIASRPPTFTQIFDPFFEFSPPTSTEAELDEIDDAPTPEKVAALSFADRLRLMCEWSENIASSMCARDLGFAFIRATLLQTGLYVPGTKGERDKGGLWVGAEFGKGGAGPTYVAPPLRGRRDPVGGFIHGGTARSIATLLTALALGRLDGSDEMMNLLKKRGSNEARSYIAEGLATRTMPGTTVSVWSKIGIVPTPDTRSDAAIVEEKTFGTVTCRYVVAALRSRGERNIQRLRALAGGVHDVIKRLHP